MRIYFDNTLINDFMIYAMERKEESPTDYKIKLSRYFMLEDVEMLAKYYAEGKKWYCTDKGQTFFDGDEVVSVSRKIWFTNEEDQKKYGYCLDNYTDIVNYEKECFKTNRAGFIEENLFHELWCTIERILRCNHENWLSDYDKRILNRARKQFENQIA